MTNKKRTTVYVAGASAERAKRAKPVMAALSRAGYVITHDWTEAVDMHGANNEHGQLTPADLEECAIADFYGVKTADIVVLLSPEGPSTGAWAELGMALAFRCQVLIAGKCDHCIFSWLPQCRRFDTDAALVEFMTNWSDR